MLGSRLEMAKVQWQAEAYPTNALPLVAQAVPPAKVSYSKP